MRIGIFPGTEPSQQSGQPLDKGRRICIIDSIMRIRLSILFVFLLLETQQIDAQALSFVMMIEKFAAIASALGTTADGLTKLYNSLPIKRFKDSKQLQPQLDLLSSLSTVSADVTDLSFVLQQYLRTPSYATWSPIPGKINDAGDAARKALDSLNGQAGAFLLPATDLDASLKGILKVKGDILMDLYNTPQPQSAAERTALRSLADSLNQENVQLTKALQAITTFLAKSNSA